MRTSESIAEKPHGRRKSQTTYLSFNEVLNDLDQRGSTGGDQQRPHDWMAPKPSKGPLFQRTHAIPLKDCLTHPADKSAIDLQRTSGIATSRANIKAG